ncbi:4Fe-4S binding protein [Methanobacterium sp. MBAC-LM]|uniref:4Fe-4S binding protein n=1 Tax=Methanobacterium sp. MBAC-LM TaxID=3412034 RepID=UPI003C74B14D
MNDNKCGCEDDKLDKKIENKVKDDNECSCGCDDKSPAETQDKPEDCECRCSDESTLINQHSPKEVEDCGCGIIEDDTCSKEDSECGCGTESTVTPKGGGCCGAIELPDLSREKNPDKPKFTADDDFIKKFEDYAYSLGIISVGYTQMTPDLMIKDKFIQYPFTIVLTVEMGMDIIKTAPGTDAQDLNNTAYVKTAILTTKLSDYLRKKGYATEVAHPEGGIVNFSALGQKAGLGYTGKSGLLITPELGPRVKVSAIFVSIANLPEEEDNEHEWIPEYCDKCNKCVKACPYEALIEKETCCGGKEVELIKKNCIGCSQGCTYCIEGCPFYLKGYEHVKNKFDKMNAKLKEKQNPQTPYVGGTKNLRFFECKKFKAEIWDNWTKQNAVLFDDLTDGSSIAVSMTENKEKLIIIEKENNSLKTGIKDLKSLQKLESPVADLLFILDEKDIAQILKDDTSSKFIDLLSSGKIEVYGLVDQAQLMDKGYVAFLNNLGLSIGGGSCCG